MWYCMVLMLHLSTTFHHVSTYIRMILHCEILHYHIVDIVHIDENWTHLIDFHGLGSTFSERMRSNVFNTRQQEWQNCCGAFIFLSFGRHQKLPKCFQNPNKKDKF